MSAHPAPASPPAPAPHPAALRNVELSDLLGHLHNCWDNERRSLSRQLHDSLGSSLTALTMHLGLLAQKLPPDPALQDRAAQMKQLLQQVVETNRQMQMRLWNDRLEFLGVRVALCEAAEQFGLQHHINVRCSQPEHELQCPRSHGVVLLHALEEGLRNVALHAHASAIDVQVDETAHNITLRLKDNGVGLVAGNDLSSGKFGLRTVRERAAYLGGTLSLSNHPDGGTLLTVVLPKPASS
ncbi:histidine kinase [Pseudoduganella sp. FT93W]|uniref:histidine kinase n=1 Tax=Duganella fentianensis TaxID=2692177 RepID=A0A845HV24_9BURK|nr:histidine kinase [Duganella fentianensis]MYN44879.1 histidine kinase [Duganella fentianensis]